MHELMKGVFITTNVASMFPRNSAKFDLYTSSLRNFIKSSECEFLAIHMQEIGKKSGTTSEEICEFITDLKNTLIDDFEYSLAYVDTGFDDYRKFTALANLYLWRNIDLKIYNFEKSTLDSAVEVSTNQFIYIFNKDAVHSTHFKFPTSMLPYGKNSRKGYTMVKFHFGADTGFITLVNLHLVHDMSFELSPTGKFPKIYAKHRKLQYEMILNDLKSSSSENALLFGDFNFRTDENTLIQELFPKCSQDYEESSSTTTFRSLSDGNLVATMHPREIRLSELYYPNNTNYKKFISADCEGKQLYLIENIYEFKMTFLPTYCFYLDDEGIERYTPNRCPSYCDRIFLYGEKLIKKALQYNTENSKPYTALFGEGFIADHKPVCLRLLL